MIPRKRDFLPQFVLPTQQISGYKLTLSTLLPNDTNKSSTSRTLTWSMDVSRVLKFRPGCYFLPNQRPVPIEKAKLFIYLQPWRVPAKDLWNWRNLTNSMTSCSLMEVHFTYVNDEMVRLNFISMVLRDWAIRWPLLVPRLWQQKSHQRFRLISTISCIRGKFLNAIKSKNWYEIWTRLNKVFDWSKIWLKIFEMRNNLFEPIFLSDIYISIFLGSLGKVWESINL